MEGLSGLLPLATIALEALLSVSAATVSGFGLFFGISFEWGHDDFLVDRDPFDSGIDKETLSHRMSISSQPTKPNIPT
jgi:hypothetical protein